MPVVGGYKHALVSDGTGLNVDNSPPADVRYGSLADKPSLGQNSALSAIVQKRTNAATIGLSAKCQKPTCVIAVVIFAKRHRWTLGNTEQSFATFVSLT
jgi:hypothetical protein